MPSTQISDHLNGRSCSGTPPFFTFAIGMALVDKMVDAVFDANVALAFMFVSDLLLEL